MDWQSKLITTRNALLRIIGYWLLAVSYVPGGNDQIVPPLIERWVINLIAKLETATRFLVVAAWYRLRIEPVPRIENKGLAGKKSLRASAARRRFFSIFDPHAKNSITKSRQIGKALNKGASQRESSSLSVDTVARRLLAMQATLIDFETYANRWGRAISHEASVSISLRHVPAAAKIFTKQTMTDLTLIFPAVFDVEWGAPSLPP